MSEQIMSLFISSTPGQTAGMNILNKMTGTTGINSNVSIPERFSEIQAELNSGTPVPPSNPTSATSAAPAPYVPPAPLAAETVSSPYASAVPTSVQSQAVSANAALAKKGGLVSSQSTYSTLLGG